MRRSGIRRHLRRQTIRDARAWQVHVSVRGDFARFGRFALCVVRLSSSAVAGQRVCVLFTPQ